MKIPFPLRVLIPASDSKPGRTLLARFALGLGLLIAVFSLLFHFVMLWEGQQHTWLTGLYWTMTVMSTLGFGDVTFTSDIGRAFSIVVMITGAVFFLVMMPFAVTQYVCIPWLERQKKDLIPREVERNVSGHVLVTGTGAIAVSLAEHLKANGYRVFVLSTSVQEAIELVGQGIETVLSRHDSPRTYERLRAADAAMLMSLDTDVRTTSIVIAAREVAPQLPIVAGADYVEARDILRMAGCTRVFHFTTVLGEVLARRVLRKSSRVGVLARFGGIVVAEAPLVHCPLAGMKLSATGLRSTTGINVAGIWERGTFSRAHGDTVLSSRMILVVCGTADQVAALDRLLSAGGTEPVCESPALILGGGRVGRAVAKSLLRSGMPSRIVDRGACEPIHRELPDVPVVQGDAASLDVLNRAGVREASTIVITTHDDDTNVYLTIYCRKLRPDAQIISRASLDSNVHGLHMAGADQVLSLSSLVSETFMGLLSPNRAYMLNELLSFFTATVDGDLAGRTLAQSGILEATGCTVAAIRTRDGREMVNPPDATTLGRGDTLCLIGDESSMNSFRSRHGKAGELVLDERVEARRRKTQEEDDEE